MKITIHALALLLITMLPAAAQEAPLPDSAKPHGWQQTGETRTFEGGALYQHINGGSEVYLEKGFQVLTVQDYINGDDEEIRLEIYVMSDGAGATGIMQENTRGLETSKEFGEMTSMDPYQILFVTGRYYVSVTCFSDSSSVQAGMQEVAGAAENYLAELL